MKYFVVVLGLILLLPLIFLIKGSFEDVWITMRMPPRWDFSAFNLENYRLLFGRTQIPRWFMNTVIIATGALGISLFSTVLAAWTFAAYQFPGKRVIYWIFIASIMIPGQALIVSKFVLMRNLGLIDTWWSLILTGGCNPVGIVILMKYIQSMPAAYPDAARIDGLNEIGILFRIMLPQCMPLIGFMLITGYMAAFGAFFWPFVMISNPRKLTLMVGITVSVRALTKRMTDSGFLQRLGPHLAGGVVMFIPTLLIFLTFQRSFKKRFLEGGLKA